jgi:uncharacterized membrane protein YfcA
MRIHDFLLVFSAFISEIAGTLSGFGSSTLFVPLAARLEDFYFVLALTSILHCFGNLAKMILFRKAFQKEIFWKMFLPSVVMTGCGALLVNYLPVEDLKIGLGLVLILVSIVWGVSGSTTFFVVGQRSSKLRMRNLHRGSRLTFPVLSRSQNRQTARLRRNAS